MHPFLLVLEKKFWNWYHHFFGSRCERGAVAIFRTPLSKASHTTRSWLFSHWVWASSTFGLQWRRSSEICKIGWDLDLTPLCKYFRYLFFALVPTISEARLPFYCLNSCVCINIHIYYFHLCYTEYTKQFCENMNKEHHVLLQLFFFKFCVTYYQGKTFLTL